MNTIMIQWGNDWSKYFNSLISLRKVFNQPNYQDTLKAALELLRP